MTLVILCFIPTRTQVDNTLQSGNPRYKYFYSDESGLINGMKGAINKFATATPAAAAPSVTGAETREL
jgi:hypothetical protein